MRSIGGEGEERRDKRGGDRRCVIYLGRNGPTSRIGLASALSPAAPGARQSDYALGTKSGDKERDIAC